ncbi:MAG: hypothetical protein PHR35_14610 [Kiritimatiellae bacterium]|nr:hypothetical protein [Kiritimatiellia bacterium]
MHFVFKGSGAAGRQLVAWAAVAALAMLAGCATWTNSDARFVVDDSQLNWMSISYRPSDATRAPCRINISAAGSVRCLTGKSPLVANDFATDTEHAQWADASENNLGMTPAEARAVLQRFADAGIMREPSRPKRERLPADVPGVAVFICRLNRVEQRCVTANPELIALIESLLHEIAPVSE